MTVRGFVKRGLENYSSNDPKRHVGLIVVTNRILKKCWAVEFVASAPVWTGSDPRIVQPAVISCN